MNTQSITLTSSCGEVTNIAYHPDSDVLTINGVHYAAEVFRSLGVLPVGSLVRIENREGGVLTLYKVGEQS